MGEIECIAFPKIRDKFADKIAADAVLRVKGQISLREDEPAKIIVSHVGDLAPNDGSPTVTDEKIKAARILYIRVPSRADMLCKRALALLSAHPGTLPVSVFDASKAAYQRETAGVLLTPNILVALTEILGEENVVLK